MTEKTSSNFATFLFIVLFTLNILLPYLDKPKLNMLFIPQILILGFHTWTLINILGYGNTKDPGVSVLTPLLLRTLEFFVFAWFFKDIKFISLIILSVFDICFILYCIWDVSQFEFVILEEEDK